LLAINSSPVLRSVTRNEQLLSLDLGKLEIVAPENYCCVLTRRGSDLIREASYSAKESLLPRRSENTIIAAFRNSSDAQAAATELEAAGISRDDIYIETGGDTSARSKRASTKEGGFTGWLKSIFAEEDDSDRIEYENAVARGNCLLRVDVDEDEIPNVDNILNRHSPVDIHADEAGAAVRRDAGTAARAEDKTTAIPVVREEVQVGKRRVLRGGVRVYSRVIEEPVEESVPLREERVRVERRPVNRSATRDDLSAGKEQVIEVEEFAEEPVIAKQARVVEEVRVGKEVSERTETVRDTVRRTEVSVEQTPGASGEQFDDTDFRADFQKRYAASGASYDTYLPAYRYGYEMASDQRYKGRSFNEVESDLRSDYGRRYPQSAWEKMKDAISYGWNKVTGKTRAAGR
jgi:uncharacterized protein (TIGR02271 family)